MAVRDRGLRLLLTGLLALSAVAALIQPVQVRASGTLQASPPSHYGETGPPQLVRLQGLTAPAAGSRPNVPKPLLLRDPQAYGAQKQLVLEGKAGRRQGVVAVAPAGVVGTPAPQTEQKLAGFPVMDQQRQVALFGSNQSVAPPDTQLAAGPTYLVEADNSTLSIWSKSGTLVAWHDLNVFFTVPSGFVFSDPRILYDAESGRWFLSGLAYDSNNNSEILIAVTTGDPS